MDFKDLIDISLMSLTPSIELEKLFQSGILNEMLPEVTAMVNFGGGQSGHKDLWNHTKQVVSQTIPELHLRWAALFHDVGKVQTISRRTGKISFHGHEFASAKLFIQAANRLRMDPKQRDQIRFLIANLGLIEAYTPDWTDAGVRRLTKAASDHIDDLLALSRADITTKYQDKKRSLLKRIDELGERIDALKIEDAKTPPLPTGIGNEIMRVFSIPPSRKVGEWRKMLEQAVDTGELAAHQPIEFYIEFIKNNQDKFKMLKTE